VIGLRAYHSIRQLMPIRCFFPFSFYPDLVYASAGVGIVDDSGKTPTAALREVGENLERLKQQSEDLLLLIEDEIRYIAKGGKPEV